MDPIKQTDQIANTEHKENEDINMQKTLLRSKILEKFSKFDKHIKTDSREKRWPLQSSDESFEAIEKMCDKTASDPNSTLFQYLHSDNKDAFVENAKIRLSDNVENEKSNENDPEYDALDKLLMDLHMNEEKQLEKQSFKIYDVTQLEDIEEPSKLWENSIFGDSILKTSPVKMVGLLRPSTILEGNEECTLNTTSSLVSFVSAVTETPSEISSSYETAQDSTTASGTNGQIELKTTYDDLVMLAKEEITLSVENLNTDILQETRDHLTVDSNLLNIFTSGECSDGAVHMERNDVTTEFDGEESVISLSSEDEIDDIDDIRTDQHTLLLCEKKEINKIESNSDNLDDSAEASLHFNDTMEEVDYMMKQGMKLIAANACGTGTNSINDHVDEATKKDIPIMAVAPQKQDTFVMSPKMCTSNFSPSPMRIKSSAPRTPLSKGKPAAHQSPRSGPSSGKKPNPINRFALDMKPIPKLDIFKKPLMSASRRKDLQFSHIISPVGAYMKKTATTPLMTNIKSNNTDLLSCSAIRELNYESCHLKPIKVPGVSKGPPGLPKKAYISSELKHYVDERTPVTIPGGKKYEKYLESALVPSVLRHDGKAKITPKLALAKESPNIPSACAQKAARSNSSLADLSVMSGDVSLYTIKDAQKF